MTQRPNAFEILTNAGLTEEQRHKVYTDLLVPIIEELETVEKARSADELNTLHHMTDLQKQLKDAERPVPMRLICPGRNPDGTPCARLHIDEPPFDAKPHHTHACQHCGEVWRPALCATVGVQFLPGYKNT